MWLFRSRVSFLKSISMSIESSMVGYYADRANEYERIYRKPERQEDLNRLREYVKEVFTGAKVFEVACGTGYWTEIIARSAESVFATDINEEVLSVARSKPIDTRRVDLCKADAYDLPVVARRFDRGFSGFWWSHIPKASIRQCFASDGMT